MEKLRDVVQIACEELRCVLGKRGSGPNANWCMNEEIFLPPMPYGGESWSTCLAERKEVNVLEMKCFRSVVRVMRIYSVKNVEVRMRIRVES